MGDSDVALPPANSNLKLTREFYDRCGLELAKDLIGCTLVKLTDGGERLEGEIVETEAYLGQEDLCCHSYQKSPTAKTKAMFMEPGTAYVYNVYYRYCCFNISCRGAGAVVLIRALRPTKGLHIMQHRRREKLKKKERVLPEKHLANGPSKLCIALGISKAECNELDLVNDDYVWVEQGTGVERDDIISTTRVGLGKHLPADGRAKPWRFYIRTSQCVSIRDKGAEMPQS